MKALTAFIKDLPGVAPLKARAAILEGDILSEEERADLHKRDSYWGPVLEVGPNAAAAILVAYRGGRLPMSKKAVPTDAPAAEAYLGRREELVAELATRNRRARALKDLALVIEADFADHQFLNELFFAHAETSAATLTLAGVAVRKTVTRYSSNSGKTQSWGVDFTWTGSDGTLRTSSHQPAQAKNRRNDADRNWGLPE
ncbi:hypothetical protein [Methylobacterium iners]|uniref:Uncharacterized protein n=1 Tax=Methylobacterium iners TaxID=418707 RepID=A0ABQ4S1W7_9HYPH|nr:hypothetical protein [Methylobacterium iners]GJD96986.1 hypothetical protein OCOJLMKI_4214 [Methylobacterium iners]